jgi:hypothetical protein
VVFVFLGLFATLLRGQPQVAIGAEPSGTSENSYSLGGTVINSATGEPIRRALVQISTGTNPVLTDGDGHFEFNNLPSGQITVSATKPGFFSEQQISQGHAQDPMVSIPSSGPAVLKLTPEGVIAGQVDGNGEPLENVQVKVFAVQMVDGRKRWAVHGGVTTDDDGAFRVANLVPGSYYVAAGPSLDFNMAVGRSSKPRETGYPEAFYPGAPDIESSTPLAVAAGQQVQADISLKPEPVYEVGGSITGAGGRGVNLEWVDRSGEFLSVPTRFDPRTEKFQAKIPAGSYVLQALSQNADGLNFRAEQILTVNSDRADVHLALGPLASIPVSVRMDGVNPEGASSMQLAGSSMPPANLHLIPVDASLNVQEYYPNIGPDAEFAMRDVPAGKYSVETAPIGHWYVASAICGSADLMREDLTVPTGGHVQAIEVVLRNDSAELTVSVSRDGQPTPADVLLVSQRAPNQPKKMSNSQGDDAHFSGLAPGEYSVLAFDRLDTLEYRNPEVLNAYLGRASHVTLLPNGKSNVTTDLIVVEK